MIGPPHASVVVGLVIVGCFLLTVGAIDLFGCQTSTPHVTSKPTTLVVPPDSEVSGERHGSEATIGSVDRRQDPHGLLG
jgi:hypothetical protein